MQIAAGRASGRRNPPPYGSLGSASRRSRRPSPAVSQWSSSVLAPVLGNDLFPKSSAGERPSISQLLPDYALPQDRDKPPSFLDKPRSRCDSRSSGARRVALQPTGGGLKSRTGTSPTRR